MNEIMFDFCMVDQLHPYSQKAAKDGMSFLVQTQRFMSLPRIKLMLMYSIIFYLKSGLKHWWHCRADLHADNL